MNTQVPFHMSCHAMITAKSKKKKLKGGQESKTYANAVKVK